MRDLSGGLTGMRQKLALSFHGDAAYGYQRDAEALQRMLQAAGHELAAEASQVRRTAMRLYQAELQALSAFEKSSL